MQAQVERVPGGYVVSRFFAVQAAAQRGMDLLLSVNEAAFDPFGVLPAFSQAERECVPAYDAHPGSLNLPSNEDGS